MSSVLEVMDAVANGIHNPHEGDISLAYHELSDFLAARDTVAELIEAVNAFDIPASPQTDRLRRLRAAINKATGEAA